ncbi:MAG: serine hydrolase [Chloroflexi bacterium]|nr:serine hydrolase [Chloroflexota bacterium]
MACASGGDASVVLSGEATVTATPLKSASPEPTSTPLIVDIPAPTVVPDQSGEVDGESAVSAIEILPLEDLAPEAVTFLEGRAGAVGVAVVVPDETVVYLYNGSALFPMASVAKVSIMLTILDQVDRIGRVLTEQEVTLIRQMITVSDNVAAYALWEAVGGAEAVTQYLESIGLNGLDLNSRYWGESLASAADLAQILAMLAGGEILEEPRRSFALKLMVDVDDTQDWGVSAGPANDPAEGTVGVKNGWYPAPDGWRVNSIGFVYANDNRLEYTVAILTNGQRSLDEGIETIEALSQIIHAEIVD